MDTDRGPRAENRRRGRGGRGEDRSISRSVEDGRKKAFGIRGAKHETRLEEKKRRPGLSTSCELKNLDGLALLKKKSGGKREAT